MLFLEEQKPTSRKSELPIKMIKEYIEAKYGFKVHTVYIAEVKSSLSLPMYDAPNAVEELKQPRKHPTEEKVEAIKDALKYYKIFQCEGKSIIRFLLEREEKYEGSINIFRVL